MIFVTVGSQKFQFNRLLKWLDTLIENNKITEEIFAQTGYSDYIPKNYKYTKFLQRDKFNCIMSKCNIVITHGGTGAIIGAVKKEKKVIAVPRLKKFKEHVDDHQLQIVDEFTKMNFIKSADSAQELEHILYKIKDCKLQSYKSNTQVIVSSIEEFIQKIEAL